MILWWKSQMIIVVVWSSIGCQPKSANDVQVPKGAQVTSST